MSTKNFDDTIYSSWEKESRTVRGNFFGHFRPFFALPRSPLNNLGNQNFENMKKMQGENENLHKTTTPVTTQKWSFWTGSRLIIDLYKTTANYCECFINNKDLQFHVLVPFWRNIPILKNPVIQVVFINECKSCEISNQMFFNVMFSFSKTKGELVMT